MYQLNHHNAIRQALAHFNSAYLAEHNILFGGGTRIALELGEFRESVDIDFLCPNKDSYRAVRTIITNKTLGPIVNDELHYIRDIRSDRYAIRTAIIIEDVKIKLEFISSDNYALKAQIPSPFNVPCIDHNSCYLTKLLAHCDRVDEPQPKDLIDLLMMYTHWGEPSEQVWENVQSHYGDKPREVLMAKMEKVCINVELLTQTASTLKINESNLSKIQQSAKDWLASLRSSC